MRTSSKLVVVDTVGRVLLLQCVDPDPGTRWWELPGGGIEPGEDAVTAAVRELREETGLVLRPEWIGPLLWTQDASFSFLGTRQTAHHQARVVRLTGDPEWADRSLTAAEAQTILDLRWWPVAEVAAADRFFPRSLPALLPRLLTGRRVDEPYDDWDLA